MVVHNRWAFSCETQDCSEWPTNQDLRPWAQTLPASIASHWAQRRCQPRLRSLSVGNAGPCEALLCCNVRFALDLTFANASIAAKNISNISMRRSEGVGICWQGRFQEGGETDDWEKCGGSCHHWSWNPAHISMFLSLSTRGLLLKDRHTCTSYAETREQKFLQNTTCPKFNLAYLLPRKLAWDYLCFEMLGDVRSRCKEMEGSLGKVAAPLAHAREDAGCQPRTWLDPSIVLLVIILGLERLQTEKATNKKEGTTSLCSRKRTDTENRSRYTTPLLSDSYSQCG